jgi:tetratricopeptide (TPR) repeat protein
MIEIKRLEHLQNAVQAAQRGDREQVLAEVDLFQADFAPAADLANPEEWLSLTAAVADLYRAVGEWGLAALKLEEVCEYAEKHHPGSTETAGDYTGLAEVLEKSGDLQGALAAIERSREHLEAAGTYEAYRAWYEKHVARLREALGK